MSAVPPTDPAEAAAYRAWFDRYPGSPYLHRHFTKSKDEGGTAGLAISAAREALKPIRELHRRFDRSTLEYTLDDRVVCSHCWGPVDWPCATARLVYPQEEL